jgi:uncharacterized protein (TIGR02145 family)
MKPLMLMILLIGAPIVIFITVTGCNKVEEYMPNWVKIYEVTLVTRTSALVNSEVLFEGSSPIIARGVCWSLSENPTINDSKTSDGTGSGRFASNITGLAPNNLYYLKAYAINEVVTRYGSQEYMKTKIGEITDIEGNIYQTVKIGNQEWISENLKTTKYNDGTDIPFVIDSTEWSNLSTPGYCWYNNDILNKTIYGALYNWHTVQTDKLCPTGWHVPNDSEWLILTDYLGGESVAGGKLKGTGTEHWGKIVSPPRNEGATNETGFTALPGGWRYHHGMFSNEGASGFWWSSTTTQHDINIAWQRSINWSINSVDRWHDDKKFGFSIRCIKD